jgi:serine/threonine protein kinase
VPDNLDDKIRRSEPLKGGRPFDAPESQEEKAPTAIVPKGPGGSNPSRDLNPGTMFGNKYQIVALVGRGGMSAVYKAYDQNLKRNVAVKVLCYKRKMDKKARARFVQEGVALSKLDHPNLIKVYEFGDADSAEPFLVMDFLEGIALSDVMAAKKALRELRAVSIIKQCVEALRHAHNKGVVHRDLKPSNVMLLRGDDRRSEIVKIIDFGIAKVDEADSARLTETGEVFGSPLYMSPEQCRGERLDERSDMYSLGCMFYELLTGRPPFVGVDFADTVGMHFNEDPKPLAQVRPDLAMSRNLDGIIGKLMAKARKDRYQTMDDVLEDLNPILEKLRSIPREEETQPNKIAPNPVAATMQERAIVDEKKPAAGKASGAQKKADQKKKKGDKKGERNGELADTLQEPAVKDGKQKAGKSASQPPWKLLSGVAVVVLLAFGAKEGYELYSGKKKAPWQKTEPVSISVLSQSSKELSWWQEDMDKAEKFFDRGRYLQSFEHFRKALKTAESMKDENKNQLMGTTLEHMIDLCYVIMNLNHGRITATEMFEDNSQEYKDALRILQPKPTREQMRLELETLLKSERPDILTADNLSDDEKASLVKIAAVTTELALTAGDEPEAVEFFKQANLHIKAMMRNNIPDFAELLIKQSQYLAGAGNSQEAAKLLFETSNAVETAPPVLKRDLAMLKYAQACLFWQMNDAEKARAAAEEATEVADQTGPQMLQMLSSATLDLINQRQKESDRKINALLPILRNQLPPQYWAVAQSLRLSGEVDLTDIRAIIKFNQGFNDGGPLAPGAAEELKVLSDTSEAKLKRSIAILMRSRPYDKREILKSYQDLAETFLAAKQFDDLEELLPTVISYGEQISDFNPIERAALTHNLGFLKQRKKDFKSAEAFYQKAIEIIGKSGVSESPINQEILSDYNSLMKAMGKPSEKLTTIPVIRK